MLRSTDEELLAQPGRGHVRLLSLINAIFSVGQGPEGEGFEDPRQTLETRTWRAVGKHDWNSWSVVLEGVVTTFTTKTNCPICHHPGTCQDKCSPLKAFLPPH